MKATAIAPSNIAFVKYWGKSDETLRLPANGSVSMNLSGLYTITTVEFSSSYTTDDVVIDGSVHEKATARVSAHLDRIRAIANTNLRAKVVSKNSFPSGTGLSSSASGFAALTKAAVDALSLNLSEQELSILARQGSGSAARSIPDGFVEWIKGATSDSSYAYSLYPPDHWKLYDVVVIVSDEKKSVSSAEGQTRAETSVFYETRMHYIEQKLSEAKDALKKKDFERLGALAEREAFEMHAIMLTSWPPLVYWTEATIAFIKQIHAWRKEGLPVYLTLNTGQDIHALCEEQTVHRLQALLRDLPYVKQIIVNTPSTGVRQSNAHLF